MAINAGTAIAYLDLDTSKYSSALQMAMSQATAFASEGTGLSGMIDGFGASLTTVGRALTMGMTLPLVGVGAAAVGVGMNFDASMSNVAALSGTAGDKFDELRAKALEMGSTTKYTASQAADAMGYMALAGWNADQMMAGLPGVLNLAAAANMDLARASDIVTDTMTPFGLAASEAGRVSDVFAKTQATSNTTVEMLGEAMKYAASNADAFGMSIEQTSAVIGLFANSGLKGSMAGTTFTSMMTDMKNSMEDGAIAIGKANVSLVDAQGNYREFPDIFKDIESATYGMSESERDAALSAVFQTRGMKGILALLKAGSEELYDYTEELENSTGAAEEMAETMQDNLKGDLTIFKSGVEGAAIALSDYLVPWLRKSVQWLTSAVTWFNNLDPAIKNTVFRIGTIAAAIGPALLVGGKLISAFSGVLPMLGMLGAGFALVYRHSERLQGFVQNLKENIPVWMDGLKTGFTTYQEAVENGQGTIDAIGIGMETAFGPVAAGRIQTALQRIQTGFRAANRYITSAMGGVGEFIGSLIDGEGAAEAMRQALEIAVGPEFAAKAEGTIATIDRALQRTKSTAISFASSARTTLAELWTDAKQDYETGGFVGVLEGLGTKLYDAMIQGASSAREGAVYLRDKIGEGLAFAGDWIKSKVLGDSYTPDSSWVNVGGSIWEKIKSGIYVSGDWIQGLVLGDAYTPDSTWVDAGKAIWTSVKSGFSAAGDLLKGLVLGDDYTPDSSWGDVGTKILSSISGALQGLDEESVNSAIGNLGSIMESISIHIVNSKANLIDFAGQFFTAIATALSSFTGWEALGSAMANVGSSFIGAIAAAIPGLTNMAVSLIGAIGTLLQNATGEDVMTSVSSVASAILNGIVSVIPSLTSIAVTLVGAIGNLLSGIDWATATTAASDIAKSLINGLADINWATLFTNAGAIVSSIGKVIAENASEIAVAALDLGLELLKGLAGVDWAALSSNLVIALGNLMTAIGDWFAVPENTSAFAQTLTDIFGGILMGVWRGVFTDAGLDLYVDPDSLLAQEGLALENGAIVKITPSVEVDETALQTSVEETAQQVNDTLGGIVITNGMPDLGIDPTIFIDKNEFSTTAQSAVDTTSQTLDNGQSTVQESSKKVTNALLTPFEELPEDTKAQAALVLVGVNQAIEEGTPEAVAAIELAGNAVFDKAKEILSSPAGMAIGSAFLIGVMTGALSVQTSLVSILHGIGSAGAGAIASAMNTSTGHSIGQSMVQAVISGVGSMASALSSRMYGLGLSAVSAFKSAIQMQSPPKAFTDIGEAIPDAVGLGTDRNRDAAIDPILDLARDMQTAFSVGLDDQTVTANAHNSSGGSADANAGGNHYEFNFHGDINVRDEGDVERVAHLLYLEVSESMRGGGQLA